VDAVSVSASVKVAALDSKSSVPFEFDFGASPIPFSASDLDIQVVFRGKLGNEEDAVAVSTLDVAEPQFFAVGNMTDWAYDDMAVTPRWRPVTETAYNTSYPLVSVALSLADPASMPQPLATIASLPPAQHAQIAFLPPAAKDQEKYHLWLSTGNISVDAYDPEEDVPIPVDEVIHNDGPPETYGTVCPVTLERGVYRQAFRYFSHIVHHHTGKQASASRAVMSGSPIQKLSPTDCSLAPPPGTGGFWDLSVITPPYGASNQASWSVHF
jgi:hypothetical protein